MRISRISRIATIVVWGLWVCALGALLLPTASHAASAQDIDAAADNTIAQFKAEFAAGATVLEPAKGVLVFPEVIQAGVGIGGQYGEGVMRTRGRSVGYYSFTGGSIGLQFGAQRKSIIVAFMQNDVLRLFREKAQQDQAFQIGGDASVAFLTVGSEAAITSPINKPIVAFVFNQAGLMGSLSLEGSNIVRIER